MGPSPPKNPVGEFHAEENYQQEVRGRLIASIASAPAKLKAAVAGLTDEQLNTRYKNWSIRQIVHHVADSHVHSYIRFKWALTEDSPTIKAYEEADWVMLDDSAAGEIGQPLAMLDGLHAKWVQLLRTMTEDQFARTFVHPQSGETVSLWNALNYYPWHSEHHTGQILWLREQRQW